VTEEFIDIQARIKTKKELENRYKELLAKANTVEELLSIEKELGTLRTEIESIEGRLKYLQDRVSLSSLTIEYYELTTSSFRFIPKLGKSFVTGWNWFLSFIVCTYVAFHRIIRGSTYHLPAHKQEEEENKKRSISNPKLLQVINGPQCHTLNSYLHHK